MADTVSTKWIYPVNWTGAYPGEGDPDPPAQKYGWKRMTVQFLNLSDGTGESLVNKLAVSELRGVQGLPCFKIGVAQIRYATYGMSVQLYWDMAPAQPIAYIPDSGEGCIKGPFFPELGEDTAYEVGETGDLLLSTIGHTASDTYDLTLDLIIKE